MQFTGRFELVKADDSRGVWGNSIKEMAFGNQDRSLGVGQHEGDLVEVQRFAAGLGQGLWVDIGAQPVLGLGGGGGQPSQHGALL